MQSNEQGANRLKKHGRRHIPNSAKTLRKYPDSRVGSKTQGPDKCVDPKYGNDYHSQ